MTIITLFFCFMLWLSTMAKLYELEKKLLDDNKYFYAG